MWRGERNNNQGPAWLSPGVLRTRPKEGGVKAPGPKRPQKGPRLWSGLRFCSLLPFTHFAPHFPKSTQAPLLSATAVTAAAAKVEAEAVTPRGLVSMPGWMKGKARSGKSEGAPRAQRRPTAAVPGQLVLEALPFLVGPVWGAAGVGKGE